MQNKIRVAIFATAAIIIFYTSLSQVEQILRASTRTRFYKGINKVQTTPTTSTVPQTTVFAKSKAEPYNENRKHLEEYENRRQRARSVCGNSKKLKATDKVLDKLLVDTKHKVVLCDIPKVVSTNFRRLFLIFAGLNESIARTAFFHDINKKFTNKYLRFLKSFNNSERETIMSDYFKFIFVRDPLDRLISAYKCRFVLTHSWEYHKIGPEIVKRFRPKDVKLYGKDSNKGVTFEEYFKYILNLGKNLHTFNPSNQHWRPYHTNCSPCGVSYDFIGKQETMKEDVKYVLDKIGESNVTFPSSSHFKPSKTAGKYKTKEQYLSSVSLETLNEIFKLYDRDYDLFGYSHT